MLKALIRYFTAPAYSSRRSFAGSIILTCCQTGEEYSLIPAGACGFYVTGTGGRCIGTAATYSACADLVDADARDAIRAFRVIA